MMLYQALPLFTWANKPRRSPLSLSFRSPVAASGGYQGSRLYHDHLSRGNGVTERGGGKYKGKRDNRRWGPETTTAKGTKPAQPKEIGKRKMAIVCGYVGSDYNGLQIDTTAQFKTIEGEMVNALFAAGLVSEPNSVDVTKIGWSRSSRTDKGVHASRIVLSMKLLVHNQWLPHIHSPQYTNKINQYLPGDIRVFSLSKVNQGFRAREAGSWREYEYLLPLSTINGKIKELNRILSKYEGSKSFHNFHRVSSKHLYGAKRANRSTTSNYTTSSSDGSNIDGPRFEIVEDLGEKYASDLDMERKLSRKREFEEKRRAGLIISVFEEWEPVERICGSVTTKNIYACRVVDIVEINGKQMVRIRIKGQSFLLHQIRLMLGAAILVCNEQMPEVALDCALLSPYFVPFPMAPPHGLILRNAGFGMNCDGTDMAMTARDGIVAQVDTILLTPEEEAESDCFLEQNIYSRVQKDWESDELNLTESWLHHHSKRYKVQQEVETILKELAAQGKIVHDELKSKVKERDVRNAQRLIDQRVTRRDFISMCMSHKELLPSGMSTDISLHFDTAPSSLITKALRLLAIHVLEGKLQADLTSQQVLDELGDMEGVKKRALEFDKIYEEEIAALKGERKIAGAKRKQVKKMGKQKD